MAVPLRPPMSHMMMEWSELPENSTLCTGSQHRAVTLPGGTPRQMCGETHAGTKVKHERVHVAAATNIIFTRSPILNESK